jgi:hypothetical protein
MLALSRLTSRSVVATALSFGEGNNVRKPAEVQLVPPAQHANVA